MQEKWSQLVDSDAVTKSVAFVKKAYNFAQAQIWPVYSTGTMVGFVFLIASMHEKQMLADCMYGSGKLHNSEEGQQLTSHASQLLDDEVQHAVKIDVFSLPAEHFRREYGSYQQ